MKWAATLLICLIFIEVAAGLATGVWSFAGLSNDELFRRLATSAVLLPALGLVIAIAVRIEDRFSRRRRMS
jgi:hypothetical protein